MTRFAIGSEVLVKTSGHTEKIRGVVVQLKKEGETALIRIHKTERTIWAFLYELQKVEPIIEWTKEHFPSMLQDFKIKGSSTSNENLLILLHGIGDTHKSLFTLGEAMQLPQTAVASFRAPYSLPFDLGYSWLHPVFDEYGELIPMESKNEKREKCLDGIVLEWINVLEAIQIYFNWPLNRIYLMGFGLGGSIALHVASTCTDRLGGVVSISGGMYHISNVHHEYNTPGLLLHSINDPQTSNEIFNTTIKELKLKKKMFFYFPIGLKNRDEMKEIMLFFDHTLYIRYLALESQTDIIEI